MLAACSNAASPAHHQSLSVVAAQQPSQPNTHEYTDPNVRAACSGVPLGQVRCFALIRTDIAPSWGVHPNVSPKGYGPADLAAAYQLPRGPHVGEGQVFAVVDAYDDPNAEVDLKVYRAQFGLKPCTTANGCFRKVNQYGNKHYPPPNPEWATEMSVDLDTASAACPNCKLILVEASPPAHTGDLSVAEDEAVKLGANVVSNSYGGYPETSSYSPGYDHPGHMIVAASGDGGYRYPFQPCSFASVICVGGTTLIEGIGTHKWFETAWVHAGSGCSALVPKPVWQTDVGCTMRSWSDVSADADPNTGVAFYDTYASQGWGVSGGTSVASPLIAGAYALAGNAASQNYAQGLWQAGGTSNFNDVTVGPKNGPCPSQYPYICAAGPGYDGITGWGTPHGIGAF
jgi:subtilase family serine protease